MSPSDRLCAHAYVTGRNDKHKTDYLTVNPFDILAHCHQSSTEPEWPFEFIPTKPSTERRRGRRGGQRHKAKRVAQKQREEQKGDSVEGLCKQLYLLRLEDDEPAREVCQAWGDYGVALTTPSPVFSPESVRHHWAPQFLPNALSAQATSPIPKAAPSAQNELPTSPRRAFLASLSLSTTGSGPTGQCNQPLISPVLGGSTTEPKRTGAISTTVSSTHRTITNVPNSTHRDINTPSHSTYPFVFSFPNGRHKHKDTATNQTLLPKIHQLPLPRYTSPWFQEIQDMPPLFARPSGSASSQRGSSVIVDLPLSWTKLPEDPPTIFENHRRDQTSRFNKVFGDLALRNLPITEHVKGCQYCQTRQFSDADCPALDAIRTTSPPVRQSPPYTYQPVPQTEDGTDVIPQSLSLLDLEDTPARLPTPQPPANAQIASSSRAQHGSGNPQPPHISAGNEMQPTDMRSPSSTWSSHISAIIGLYESDTNTSAYADPSDYEVHITDAPPRASPDSHGVQSSQTMPHAQHLYLPGPRMPYYPGQPLPDIQHMPVPAEDDPYAPFYGQAYALQTQLQSNSRAQTSAQEVRPTAIQPTSDREHTAPASLSNDNTQFAAGYPVVSSSGTPQVPAQRQDSRPSASSRDSEFEVVSAPADEKNDDAEYVSDEDDEEDEYVNYGDGVSGSDGVVSLDMSEDGVRSLRTSEEGDADEDE
jgi:hypothetical protein